MIYIIKGIISIGLCLALVLGMGACVDIEEASTPDVEIEPYSFIVGGHAYGAPGVDNIGFHPPFFRAFEYFKTLEDLKFSFLTGDVVWKPTQQNFDEIFAQMDSLEVAWHIAPGNHDLEDTLQYAQSVGPRYYSFDYQNDVFILLDGGEYGWNIQGEQLELIKTAINSNEDDQIIYLFVHQLIWYEEEGEYASCRPNSEAGRADTSNFYSELLPILESSEKEVIIFAGDIGAFENGCAVAIADRGKIKFIASGMGGGKKDNVILVRRQVGTPIEFELLALNGEDRFSLGLLEDYHY